MTLTKNQIHDRIGDLAGMIKAAESEASAADQRRTDQQRLLDIAEEGVARATDRLHALLSERAELVAAYAAAVLGVPQGAIEGAPEDEDEDEELELSGQSTVEAVVIQEVTALFEPQAEGSVAESAQCAAPAAAVDPITYEVVTAPLEDATGEPETQRTYPPLSQQAKVRRAWPWPSQRQS